MSGGYEIEAYLFDKVNATIADLKERLATAERERDEARRITQSIGVNLLELSAENRGLSDGMGFIANRTEQIGDAADIRQYARAVLLNAPDTAAEVERVKGLEAVKMAYESEWRYPGPTCTCDEAYRVRGLEDPSCMYHQSPAVWEALAALSPAGEGEGKRQYTGQDGIRRWENGVEVEDSQP
jgi:hypothetical protein